MVGPAPRSASFFDLSASSPAIEELSRALESVSFAADRVLGAYFAYDPEFYDVHALWRQWHAFATVRRSHLAPDADFLFEYVDPARLAHLWHQDSPHALPTTCPAAAHRANCATLLHVAWQLPEPDVTQMDGTRLPLDPDMLDTHLETRDGSQLVGAARDFLRFVVPHRWPGMGDVALVNAYFFLRIRNALALLGRALQGYDARVMTRLQVRNECQAALTQVTKASTVERDWTQLVQAGRMSSQEQQTVMALYTDLATQWCPEVEQIIAQHISAPAPPNSRNADLLPGQQAAEAIAAFCRVSQGAAELTELVREFLAHPEFIIVPTDSNIADTSLFAHPNRSSSLQRSGLGFGLGLPRSVSLQPSRNVPSLWGRASMPPNTMQARPPSSTAAFASFSRPRLSSSSRVEPRARLSQSSASLASRIGNRLVLPSDEAEPDKQDLDEDVDPDYTELLSMSQRRQALEAMNEESSSDPNSMEGVPLEDGGEGEGTMRELEEEEEEAEEKEEKEEEGEEEEEEEEDETDDGLPTEPPLPTRPRTSRPRRVIQQPRRHMPAMQPEPDSEEKGDDDDRSLRQSESDYDYLPPAKPTIRPARPPVVLGAQQGKHTRSSLTGSPARRPQERIVFGPNNELVRTTVDKSAGSGLDILARHRPVEDQGPEPRIDSFDSQGVWPSATTQNQLAQAEGSTPPLRRRSKMSDRAPDIGHEMDTRERQGQALRKGKNREKKEGKGKEREKEKEQGKKGGVEKEKGKSRAKEKDESQIRRKSRRDVRDESRDHGASTAPERPSRSRPRRSGHRSALPANLNDEERRPEPSRSLDRIPAVEPDTASYIFDTEDEHNVTAELTVEERRKALEDYDSSDNDEPGYERSQVPETESSRESQGQAREARIPRGSVALRAGVGSTQQKELLQDIHVDNERRRSDPPSFPVAELEEEPLPPLPNLDDDVAAMVPMDEGPDIPWPRGEEPEPEPEPVAEPGLRVPSPRDQDQDHSKQQERHPLAHPSATAKDLTRSAVRSPRTASTTWRVPQPSAEEEGFEEDEEEQSPGPVDTRQWEADVLDERRHQLARAPQYPSSRPYESSYRSSFEPQTRRAHVPRFVSPAAMRNEMIHAARSLASARQSRGRGGGATVSASPSTQPELMAPLSIRPRPIVRPRQPRPSLRSRPPALPPRRPPPAGENGTSLNIRVAWTAEETDTLLRRFAWVCHLMYTGRLHRQPLWALIKSYHGIEGEYDHCLARFSSSASALRDRIKTVLEHRRRKCMSEPWWVKDFLGQSEHVSLWIFLSVASLALFMFPPSPIASFLYHPFWFFF